MPETAASHLLLLLDALGRGSPAPALGLLPSVHEAARAWLLRESEAGARDDELATARAAIDRLSSRLVSLAPSPMEAPCERCAR